MLKEICDDIARELGGASLGGKDVVATEVFPGHVRLEIEGDVVVLLTVEVEK